MFVFVVFYYSLWWFLLVRCLVLLRNGLDGWLEGRGAVLREQPANVEQAHEMPELSEREIESAAVFFPGLVDRDVGLLAEPLHYDMAPTVLEAVVAVLSNGEDFVRVGLLG